MRRGLETGEVSATAAEIFYGLVNLPLCSSHWSVSAAALIVVRQHCVGVEEQGDGFSWELGEVYYF